MLALITGASSGIGKEFAKQLASKGYDLILVSRRLDKLEEVKQEILKENQVKIDVEAIDLIDENKREELINKYQNIDILINNAGFGKLGYFDEIPYQDEDEMIKLNVLALHHLLKAYYDIFSQRKSGYILNVASIAAFQPGPKMATYYATKAYVLSISESVHYEAKKLKNNVYVSCLCPGPTESNFDKVANSKFSLKKQSSEVVVRKAIRCLFKNKRVIFPSSTQHLGIFFERFIPTNATMRFCYNAQNKKG